mmetsp:Transcript_13379/g.21997  ORF Transcript_13379/g.21997 Transcript_13379/m.21997 type:complete len:153 (+) Transcript_13379:109-567(+)
MDSKVEQNVKYLKWMWKWNEQKIAARKAGIEKGPSKWVLDESGRPMVLPELPSGSSMRPNTGSSGVSCEGSLRRSSSVPSKRSSNASPSDALTGFLLKPLDQMASMTTTHALTEAKREYGCHRSVLSPTYARVENLSKTKYAPKPPKRYGKP